MRSPDGARPAAAGAAASAAANELSQSGGSMLARPTQSPGSSPSRSAPAARALAAARLPPPRLPPRPPPRPPRRPPRRQPCLLTVAAARAALPLARRAVSGPSSREPTCQTKAADDGSRRLARRLEPLRHGLRRATRALQSHRGPQAPLPAESAERGRPMPRGSRPAVAPRRCRRARRRRRAAAPRRARPRGPSGRPHVGARRRRRRRRRGRGRGAGVAAVGGFSAGAQHGEDVGGGHVLVGGWA